MLINKNFICFFITGYLLLQEMSSHPRLDILREFNIADTSFSVIGSRDIILVLLFFLYDSFVIGSVWFCGMFLQG